MKTFMASEFGVTDDAIVWTGRKESYQAEDADNAVASVLATKRLKDGRAYVGPTGRVVYANGLGYTVTPE